MARCRPLKRPRSRVCARKTASSAPPTRDADKAADDDDEEADDGAPLAELSARRQASVWRDPSLLRAARTARREIDRLFADPRALDPRRLLDPFFVPDQYNFLRTQPGALLGDAKARAIADALASFGEARLGLRAITPPWVSFYLDGAGQDAHVDGFQGPLAFVLPLSRWGDEGDEDEDMDDSDEDEEEEDAAARGKRRPRVFTGGETAILRGGVLRYWDGEGETAAAAAAAADGGTAAAMAAAAGETTAAKAGGRQRLPSSSKAAAASSASRKEATGGRLLTTTTETPVDLSGGFFSAGRGQELDTLFARVPPRFGRLLAFDGRMPHGVRPVRCPSSDPRDARIALHGWFAPPDGPFFSGALGPSGEAPARQRRAAERALDAALRPLLSELARECPPACGLLTLRLCVDAAGAVVVGGGGGGGDGVEWLADTLVVSPGACAEGGISEREARALVQHVCAQRLKGMVFPAVGAPSTVTVPLVFD